MKNNSNLLKKISQLFCLYLIQSGKIKVKGSVITFLQISDVSKRCQNKSTHNVRDSTTFDPRQSVRSVLELTVCHYVHLQHLNSDSWNQQESHRY